MSDSAALGLVARRLAISSHVWRPMLLPAAVVVLFTALYSVLCGFALSGDQSAERDLGRADHRVATAVEPGDNFTGPTAQMALQNDLENIGVSQSWIVLQSFDVRPDAIPRPLTTGKSRVVNYLEGNGLQSLFAKTLTLKDGRWPKAPGEVVITTALRDRLTAEGNFDGREFTAFSGLVTFHVTGTYTDKFAEASYAIAAAPGTWWAMPHDTIADRFTGTGALENIFWTGSTTGKDVAGVLAKAAPGNVRATNLLTGLVDRSHVAASDDLSLVDTANFIFTLPYAVLMIAATAMAARAVVVWAGPLVTTMVEVGLRRRRVVALITTVSVVLAAAASSAGVLIGVVVGQLVRLVVLPAIVEQPVGPIRSVTPIILLALASGVLVSPAAFGPLLIRGTGTSRVRLAVKMVPWTLLRFLAVGILLVRSIGAAPGHDTDADSAGPLIAQLVAATLLLVPELLRLLMSMLPMSSPRGLLAKRLMQADRTRFSIIAILIAVSFAAPSAAATFVATTTRTEAAANLAQVPAGQLWVDRSEGKPATKASEIIQRRLGTPPIAIGSTLVLTEGDIDSPGAIQMGIGMIDSAADLGRLMGPALSKSDADLLNSGGVLLISGSADNRSVQSQSGRNRPKDLPVAFTLVKGVPSELQNAYAGFMLTATAQQFGVTRDPSRDIYLGLSDSKIHDLVDAVRADGRDTHSIQYHVVPDPTKPSRDWYTGLIGLISVTALILGALMAVHGAQLRETATRLVTLGLVRRWTTWVGVYEFGVIILGAGLAALVASTSAVALLAESVKQRLVLDIPWAFITVTITVTLAVCLALLLFTLRSRRT